MGERVDALQSAGSAVGEYVGDRQGESDHVAQAVVVDADLVVDDQLEDEDEDSIDDADPLLFLYDCNDHIIEIAAVLINCPVPYNNTSFSSLAPGEIAVRGVENISIFYSSHQDHQHHTYHDPW